MKKIAICGVWHVHAGGYTETAGKFAEVIGVWDENEKMKNDFCQKSGLHAFSTFQELLESDAEGVIVCASTESHTELLIQLANAGKHIFTEKVLALTEEDCDRVAEAVSANNVNFVISLPHKFDAGPLTVKQIADSGELGKINFVRYRNCHSGSIDNWLPEHFYNAKECGGGAMIDLGAHGMYIIDWLCGRPTTCKSIFTHACTNEAANQLNKDGVEDNAITVMEFENGCIAVNETGFVSKYYPMIFEVGGEKGTVIFNGTSVEKRTAETEGKPVTVPMCAPLPKPIEQFVTGQILEGCGMKEAKALTHLMAEAYK